MSVTMAPFTSRVSTTLPGSASERRLGRRAPFTRPQRSVAWRPTLLLRLSPSPRPRKPAPLVLLLPFAFRQVLLARLLPARLRRARYYVGSDSSSSPDFRLFRSSARSLRAQAGPWPGTVWQLKRRLPPPAIAITGSRLPVWVEREEEVSLNLLPVFPTAPPRITSEFSVPARSLAGSGWRLRPAKQVGLPPNALVTGSLDCGSAVGLRSSGPRLAATPYPVDYPAQERSARTRLSLVRPPKGQTYLAPCFSVGFEEASRSPRFPASGGGSSTAGWRRNHRASPRAKARG